MSKTVLQSVNDITALFARAERSMHAARSYQEEASRELLILCETLGITLPGDMAPHYPIHENNGSDTGQLPVAGSNPYQP